MFTRAMSATGGTRAPIAPIAAAYSSSGTVTISEPTRSIATVAATVEHGLRAGSTLLRAVGRLPRPDPCGDACTAATVPCLACAGAGWNTTSKSAAGAAFVRPPGVGAGDRPLRREGSKPRGEGRIDHGRGCTERFGVWATFALAACADEGSGGTGLSGSGAPRGRRGVRAVRQPNGWTPHWLLWPRRPCSARS